MVEAFEAGGSNGEDGSGQAISAVFAKYSNLRGVSRCAPEDMLAGEEVDGIEGAGIAIIVGTPDLADELDAGSVRQIRIDAPFAGKKRTWARAPGASSMVKRSRSDG